MHVSPIISTLRSLFAVFLLLATGAAFSQASPNTVKHEINALFMSLAQSKCEFNRNGSWYSTKQATDHLQQKYGYLAGKGTITTTESFIDLAASKSSVSGKPYLVRCADKPVIESKQWFTEELKALRSAGGY